MVLGSLRCGKISPDSNASEQEKRNKEENKIKLTFLILSFKIMILIQFSNLNSHLEL